MELIDAAITGYAVFAALLLGSFINLAADRLPRGESVVTPRSHCRSCGRQLTFIDLLPAAGYLLRGGRCASCHTLIGLTSPLVEAIAGALMLAALAWRGLWSGLLLGAFLVTASGLAVVGFALRVNLRRVKRVSPGVPLRDDASADQLVQRPL